MNTIYVATNFREECSTEERLLGEAYQAIREADAAREAFVAALRKVQQQDSQEADEVAAEVLSGLRDVCNDASWGRLVAEAAEAFDVARVRPIKRA